MAHHPSPHRRAVVIAGSALTLAACGSPAINTSGVDESLSPYPSASAITIPSASPSAQASASASATAHATSAPTHRVTPKPSTTVKTPAPTHAAPPPTHSGGHTVTPTSATITVTPSTGLASTQTVTIHGSHFNPKIQVIAVECVDKGSNTQANNCNINLLSLPQGFYPAANGTFTTTLTVQKSFGGNTCSTSTPCLVSVTEANNNPSEEADAPIRFN